MFTLWVFGMRSYKDRKEEFTFAARYAFDNCYFISVDLLKAVGGDWENGDEKTNTLK